jgi:hypothetical protein
MASNTIPVYRHGRKFYVSTDEYARIRSQERQLRRTAVQKSQNLSIPKANQTPMRVPSASSYNSIQRSSSNPYEYRYGILKTPHLPSNSLINTYIQSDSIRPSRSILRRSDDQNNLLLAATKKSPSATIRSSSSDKILDNRRTPQSLSSIDNDIIRTLSDEILQPSISSPKQSPIPSRRSVVPKASDYGISPTTTFSMTPTDQTHTQTNASKLTNYLTRIKQSSLNPPSLAATNLGTGSFFETGVQGSDHAYTVLGASNRRIGSLLTRSTSDNIRNKYYQQNIASDSFSDDNPSLIQRQESSGEIDDDYYQQRELWTRSTVRSQSSDGLTEKKRVRFADIEGLTLESKSDKDKIPSSINNQLLTRRQNVPISSDLRGRPRPFYNTFYQTTPKVDGNKLATNV